MQIDLTDIVELAKGAASLVAIVGLPATYFTYRRTDRTRRANLLISLHVRFFETELYTRIRRILDYKREPEYSQLADAVATGGYNPLADELYRYLNFFELLASLENLRQLKRKEILKLFDYDLKLIRRSPFVRTSLESEGFEQLTVLINCLDEKET